MNSPADLLNRYEADTMDGYNACVEIVEHGPELVRLAIKRAARLRASASGETSLSRAQINLSGALCKAVGDETAERLSREYLGDRRHWHVAMFTDKDGATRFMNALADELEADNVEADEYPVCPVCGDPIDYCQGHGEIAAETLGLDAPVDLGDAIELAREDDRKALGLDDDDEWDGDPPRELCEVCAAPSDAEPSGFLTAVATPDGELLCCSACAEHMALKPAPLDRYHTVHLRLQLVDLDGKELNYSVGREALAAGRAGPRDVHGEIVRYWEQREVCKADRVLIDSGVPEEFWSEIRFDAQRARNMTMDAGRPSDATRSAVAAWKRAHGE